MQKRALVVLPTMFFAVFAVALGEAQTCKAPPTSGPGNTWAQGTRVTVYVDPRIPGWSSEEFRNVVKGAFSAWDHVGGSDVSFTIVADAERAHEPPANAIGLIQGNRNDTHLRPGAFNLGSAVIEIDDYSANPGAMRSPLAHEVGHTFGLDNCLTCQAGQSIMGPGGLPTPTPCDRRAVKENGGYFGIDVGDGRKRPEDCQDCGVQNCTVTILCRCPNRDCGTKEGRLVGDWQCTEMGRTCSGGRGCCRGDAGGVGALSELVCSGWERASDCEWGSVCCFDPTLTNAIEPPTCEAMGWYEDSRRGTCETVSGTTCTSVILLGFADYESEPLMRECWQPIADAVAPHSCGALGGDYCSQSGICPAGYSVVSGSSDCNPCCEAGQSCGEMGGDYCSQSGTCPSGFLVLGTSWDCTPCCRQNATVPTATPALPSCGEMGGDYCSQSGGCPSGYSSLGLSYDCRPCCRLIPPPPPPPPTPTPSGPSCGELGGTYCSQSGSCPGGFFSLGASWDCNPCCKETPPTPSPTPTATPSLPSCGAMGGDYCSQSGTCPSGYSSLGLSFDCSPCCKQNSATPTPTPALPSCGAMGGDYCSQSGSCPGGYGSLGLSLDCSPCCRQNPATPTPTPRPAAPSCGGMGGDYCSQSGGCPGTHDSLGRSYDCNPCCVSKPSCGAMGGDYCSQGGSCPDGYSSLGRSVDCNPCCLSQSGT